jgi:hypothetical protein
VSVFQEQGVRNAEYTFIATAYGWFRTDRRAAKNYYPGDDVVDDISADGYNYYSCRPNAHVAWQSPQTVFESFRQFGLQHPQQGLVIAEFGSVEDPAVAGRKAQWFTDFQNMLKQPGHGQFRAVAEWYSGSSNPGPCLFTIDSSPSSLSAFKAWGADSQYADMAVAPTTVRQVSAEIENVGTAAVSWAAAGPGGSPVTGYTVTVQQTGETFTVNGTSGSFTYTAGHPGSYSFTVSATNASGTSRPSAATAPVSLG